MSKISSVVRIQNSVAVFVWFCLLPFHVFILNEMSRFYVKHFYVFDSNESISLDVTAKQTRLWMCERYNLEKNENLVCKDQGLRNSEPKTSP